MPQEVVVEPKLPGVRPIEQLPIVLFDAVVLALRGDNGLIYLSFPDLCAMFNQSVQRQRRRVGEIPTLTPLASFRIFINNQVRVIDAMVLDDVASWIMATRPRKLDAVIERRIAYVQQYLKGTVNEAFAALTGLEIQRSNRIESLGDLEQLDESAAALQELQERQQRIEASQDKARTAFRDLKVKQGSVELTVGQLGEEIARLRQELRRVQAILESRISPEQQNTLYRLVHAWGDARAATKGTPSGAEIRRSWAELNELMGVTQYTKIPAARFDEAVRFVQEHYRALTGQELPAAQQNRLELPDA
jgi:hypothetical protein